MQKGVSDVDTMHNLTIVNEIREPSRKQTSAVSQSSLIGTSGRSIDEQKDLTHVQYNGGITFLYRIRIGCLFYLGQFCRAL
jgi:hypothetical protein